MTTQTIFTETGPAAGYAVVCSVVAPLPRVRRQSALDAAWGGMKPVFHKSTRVSVPGCRGRT